MNSQNQTRPRRTARLRPASVEDLDALNAVIEAAVLAWPLADRVKRLSLPLLRYDPMDLRDYTMLQAESEGVVVGVAAWCEARDASAGLGGHVLLHGLYVHPSAQGQGLGGLLIRAVGEAARSRNLRGLRVKAERVSAGYFEDAGFARLPVNHEPGAAYPHQFWMALPDSR